MRKAGLGLALVACAQLTLLSSPAFAQDPASGSSGDTSSGSASASGSASPSGTASPSGDTSASPSGSTPAPASTDSSSASTDSSSASTDASATPAAPDPNKEKIGWTILGIGGAVAVGGIILDIVGTQVGNDVPGQTGTTTSDAKTNFYWGGTTMIIAGALAGIYGGSMIVSARKAAEPQPAQANTDGGHTDNTSKAVQAAMNRAPTLSLPLVSAHF